MNFRLAFLVLVSTLYHNSCESTPQSPSGCILGPPDQTSGSSSSSAQLQQQPVYSNPQLSQSIQPIPPLGPQSSSPPYDPQNIGTPFESSNSVFNRPPPVRSSTPSRGDQRSSQPNSNDYQTPVNIQYDQQAPLAFPPNTNPNRVSPMGPVYDRTGFRREPLHPSYSSTTSKTNQPIFPTTPFAPSSDASGNTRPPFDVRSNDRNNSRQTPTWSRFNPSRTDATTLSNQSTKTVTKSITALNTPGLTPTYYDPTRRPKTSSSPAVKSSSPNVKGTSEGTSKRPFFFSPFQTTTPIPPTTRVSFDQNSIFREPSNKPKDADQPIDSSSDANVQTVPEYAFVKQPINKVLDQPDLELDNKPVKFTIMKDAMYRTGLLDLISGPGPITLFTPTDDAFLSLPPETLNRMQQNPSYLRNTILRHVVNFDVPPNLLRNNIIIPSYSGEPLIMNVALGGKVSLSCLMFKLLPISSFK